MDSILHYCPICLKLSDFEIDGSCADEGIYDSECSECHAQVSIEIDISIHKKREAA